VCDRLSQPDDLLDLLQRLLGGRTGRNEAADGELSALTDAQRQYLETIYRYNQFKRGLPTRGPRPASP